MCLSTSNDKGQVVSRRPCPSIHTGPFTRPVPGFIVLGPSGLCSVLLKAGPAPSRAPLDQKDIAAQANRTHEFGAEGGTEPGGASTGGNRVGDCYTLFEFCSYLN